MTDEKYYQPITNLEQRFYGIKAKDTYTLLDAKKKLPPIHFENKAQYMKWLKYLDKSDYSAFKFYVDKRLKSTHERKVINSLFEEFEKEIE